MLYHHNGAKHQRKELPTLCLHTNSVALQFTCNRLDSAGVDWAGTDGGVQLHYITIEKRLFDGWEILLILVYELYISILNIAFKDPFHFHFLCSIHFTIANIFQLETDIKRTNTSLSKLPWIKMSKMDILATALSMWLFPQKMQTFQTNATNATMHPLMQAI